MKKWTVLLLFLFSQSSFGWWYYPDDGYDSAYCYYFPNAYGCGYYVPPVDVVVVDLPTGGGGGVNAASQLEADATLEAWMVYTFAPMLAKGVWDLGEWAVKKGSEAFYSRGRRALRARDD